MRFSGSLIKKLGINDVVVGSNPNFPDVDGRTPLHCSIVNVQKSLDLIRLLLKAGADSNRADIFGYTPLHLAALHEFPRCVMMLLEYGGDVTARTKGGISVLNFVTKKTPEVIPKYILKYVKCLSLRITYRMCVIFISF